MTTHVLFIARRPHEVNGQLAAHDGRLLLIVPNYTQVHAEPPAITDGQSQVFALEVKHDEVVEQMDNGQRKLILWTGDPQARSRPHDKLTLPIASLIPLGGVDTDTAVDKARLAFAELPDAVKLAAIIASVPEQALIDMPVIGPATAPKLRQWAEDVLQKAVK